MSWLVCFEGTFALYAHGLLAVEGVWWKRVGGWCWNHCLGTLGSPQRHLGGTCFRVGHPPSTMKGWCGSYLVI